MTQEINKEMDLLLRRLGRREETSASDVNLRSDGEHLDADELSSYAENALPAAARARYMEHLADCSSCRALVVGLSSSVGFVVAEETAKASAPLGLRSFLASLFSPMVLRYSVPALGLIVVAVIGIGLWRRENLQRASRMSPELSNQPAVANDPAAPQSSPNAIAQNLEKPASPTAPANRQDRTGGEAPPPPPNAAPAVTVTADVAQEPPAKKPEQQPTARAVAELPVASPSVALDEARRNIESEARKEAQDRVDSVQAASRERAYQGAKREDKRSADVAAARPAAKTKDEAPDSKARIQAGVASVGNVQRDGIEAQDKDDAEVRSVGGRRFRRQNGIWVDTAYDSSKNVTSLTRGSEQYRALIADEPTIKNIAEQLDGEIIVVWKGRPYRIR